MKTLAKTLTTLKVEYYVQFTKEMSEDGVPISCACLFKRGEGLDEDKVLAGVSAVTARELSKLTVNMLSESEACE